MLHSPNFTKRYTDSQQASCVRTRKSPGGILDMVDLVRPGGDMAHPAVSELVLFQDQLGGSRVSGNSGDGISM
jgi:AraC family transcriptional regulator